MLNKIKLDALNMVSYAGCHKVCLSSKPQPREELGEAQLTGTKKNGSANPKFIPNLWG